MTTISYGNFVLTSFDVEAFSCHIAEEIWGNQAFFLHYYGAGSSDDSSPAPKFQIPLHPKLCLLPLFLQLDD